MIVWTIAGSDSGGGAGIQADLKTMHGLGAHPCTVITALTAQNTRGVSAAIYVTPDMIKAQLEALAADLPPKAIKTGMLGDAATIRVVSDWLADRETFLVCDPVLVATSGDSLMEDDAREVLISRLFPRVDLLTPNLPEAEALTGKTIASEAEMVDAANCLLAMGVRSVLIKGGHGSTEWCRDYWSDGQQHFFLSTPRLDSNHTHGSGCTLSAAITACIGMGYDPEDALVIGKAFVTQAIREARPVGTGNGPVLQAGWPEHARDMPMLSPVCREDRPAFPDCGPEPLGFYPIVDRASWLERLLPCGVRTCQLRIKDLEGEALEQEICRAIELARHHEARLFINDYWELAIRHGAYGVHLGQEDLVIADIEAILDAGLRLGVSTHSYGELARALAVRPSYLALGPIYETTTKVMRFGPQGLERLARWRRLWEGPLVAIGGLTLARAPGVQGTGADSLSVITAITHAEHPEQEAEKWLALF